MSKPPPVRKAVLPVAGMGTRFLPATKAVPKEMLPVVDKPVVQYAVEEAREAGIEQFIFVTGRGKNVAIEDHFDHSYELESLLKEREKTEGAAVAFSKACRNRAPSASRASSSRWALVMPYGAPATSSAMNHSQCYCRTICAWAGLAR